MDLPTCSLSTSTLPRPKVIKVRPGSRNEEVAYGTIDRRVPVHDRQVDVECDYATYSSTTSLTKGRPKFPATSTSFSRPNHMAQVIRVSDASRTSSPSSNEWRLREENARLQMQQEEILRGNEQSIEMHLSEIRMLKDEAARLRGQLQRTEDERNKSRQLAREWHKFGRYTSDLMKQEVRAYESKLREVHAKLRSFAAENYELRQLCIYLDKQRENLRNTPQSSNRGSGVDVESDDQGCGSSEGEEERRGGYCLQKETSLRAIATRHDSDRSDDDALVAYIQSLESRIQHLEIAQNGVERSWRSSVTSDGDEPTVMEAREWRDGSESRGRRNEGDGHAGTTCSTMTSSGTTFCSSEADDLMTSMSSSGIYVDGTLDTPPPFPTTLEVRSLPPIEEERKDDDYSQISEKRLSAEVVQSSHLPPCIEPVSSTTMSMGGRLRSSSADIVSSSSSPISSSPLLLPSFSASHSRVADYALRGYRASDAFHFSPHSAEPATISEAVEALRMQEESAYGRIEGHRQRPQTARHVTAL